MVKKRILHVSSAPSWRGGEQQIAYLWKGLAELGFEQHLFVRAGAPLADYAQENGWSFTTYAYGGGVSLGTSLRLRHLVQKLSPDVVHVHDSHSHTYAWLARLSVPMVVHRRVDFAVRGWLSRMKYNAPSIQKIICVSSAIRDILCPIIKDTTKLAVIHSGVDTARHTVPKVDIRRELGIPDGTVFIGNVAALADHKDYPTFVRTAIQLVKDGVAAHFLLIGRDDGEGETIRQQIQASGMVERFHLLGHRTDVIGVLKSLDVLLFTSKTEGLGTSIIDAFLCRIPVVAAAAGGIPELVEHQKTGLLCPVGDEAAFAKAVRFALHNFTEVEEIKEAAYQRGLDFSFREMARRVAELYAQW